MKKIISKLILKLKSIKKIHKALMALLLMVVLLFTSVIVVNFYVILSTKSKIMAPEKACHIQDVDCILVLGCYVRPDGTPSNMLYDRITAGVELYTWNTSPKILMSGDHGRVDYNEVGKMKEVAIDMGVPSEDIFMDHAGFSTYESMYRAKEIFGAKKIIIVSQRYHLYRAIYIAESLGMEAYGVSSDYHTYGGQGMRDIREIVARVKDFTMSIIKPQPTYLGDKIPLDQSGDVTND